MSEQSPRIVRAQNIADELEEQRKRIARETAGEPAVTHAGLERLLDSVRARKDYG